METKPKNMYFIYIDESYDKTHYAYSSIFIDAFRWHYYFQELKNWRRKLYEVHGISKSHELHATKFLAGRGEPNKNRDFKYRTELFYESIGMIENLKDIMIINAITDERNKHLTLFNLMLNRINRTLNANDAFGVLICDEGNEKKLIHITRSLRKYNPIPWSRQISGNFKNIPLSHIIEDPLFKTSDSSYFIQMADFVAYSLLRSESTLGNKTKFNGQFAFDQLDKVLVKQAYRDDPRQKGIVRA